MKYLSLLMLFVSVLMLGCNSPVETPTESTTQTSVEDGGDASTPKPVKYTSPLPKDFVSTNQIGLKIMDPISESERRVKYEKPLSEALKNNNLGILTATSSSSINGKVDSVGFGIYSDDPARAIELVSKVLREIGAPKGTTFYHQNKDKERFTTPLWPEDSDE